MLDLVKRDGPISADALAERLGITAMAVRQHLGALKRKGWRHSRPRHGRAAGR